MEYDDVPSRLGRGRHLDSILAEDLCDSIDSRVRVAADSIERVVVDSRRSGAPVDVQIVGLSQVEFGEVRRWVNQTRRCPPSLSRDQSESAA